MRKLLSSSTGNMIVPRNLHDRSSFNSTEEYWEHMQIHRRRKSIHHYESTFSAMLAILAISLTIWFIVEAVKRLAIKFRDRLRLKKQIKGIKKQLVIKEAKLFAESKDLNLQQENMVEKACAICIEPLKEGDQVSWSKASNCKHVYHADCILPWLMNHAECPSCRGKFIFPESSDSPNDFVTKLDESRQQLEFCVKLGLISPSSSIEKAA